MGNNRMAEWPSAIGCVGVLLLCAPVQHQIRDIQLCCRRYKIVSSLFVIYRDALLAEINEITISFFFVGFCLF